MLIKERGTMFDPIEAIRFDQMIYPVNNLTKQNFCFNPFACRIKVEGKGTVYAMPDLLTAVIGVRTENVRLAAAQAENAARTKQLLDAWADEGIPTSDIQTYDYAVYPMYDYTEGRQILRGYGVVHSFLITIRDIENAGRIIDMSVQNGANEIGQLTFSVEDPSRYYGTALSRALEDADRKAAAIGEKLGVAASMRPVSIVEERFDQGPPVGVSGIRTDAATQIQPGRLEITATVHVLYTY
jgi:uncharacterized protein YggE